MKAKQALLQRYKDMLYKDMKAYIIYLFYRDIKIRAL